MKYGFLLPTLLCAFAIACGGSDEESSKTETPTTPQALHEGSSPVLTTQDNGDKSASNAPEETKGQADSAASHSLRITSILSWKKGDELPSDAAIAAANKALEEQTYAASEEGQRLKRNLLLIKAAKMNAKGAGEGNGDNKRVSPFPATPPYNESVDRPTATMQEPDGDILVREGIELARDGRAELKHRQAFADASNLTKTKALGLACDLLIANEESDVEDEVKVQRFAATTRFLTELIAEWKALNDEWRSFLSFDPTDLVPRREMIWRYGKACEILGAHFR